jgi:hypothetical protein
MERIGRTRIHRKALDRKFKERDLCDGPEKNSLAWYWKTSRTDETGDEKYGRIDLGKKEEED